MIYASQSWFALIVSTDFDVEHFRLVVTLRYSSSVRVITVCRDFAETLTDVGHQKSVITPCLERVKDLKRDPDPFSNSTI
jgi:hypothetical protein